MSSANLRRATGSDMDKLISDARSGQGITIDLATGGVLIPNNSPSSSPKRKASTTEAELREQLADVPFLENTPIPKETTDWARVTFDTNDTAAAINNLLKAADKIVEEQGGQEPAVWKEVELSHLLATDLAEKNPKKPAPAESAFQRNHATVMDALNLACGCDKCQTFLKNKTLASLVAAPAELEEGEIQQPGPEYGPLVERAEYSELLQHTGCVINIAPPVGNIAAASGVFGGENTSGRKPWKSVIQADQAMTVDSKTFNILKVQLIRDFERGLEAMDEARESGSKVSRIHVIRK